MFTGLFHMHETCETCHLRYEREPGYFLGSIYVNYGLMALVTTVTWIVLRFRFDFPAVPLLGTLVAFCVVFGLFFFRYARALWLAMDCCFASAEFFDGEPAAPGGSHERE